MPEEIVKALLDRRAFLTACAAALLPFPALAAAGDPAAPIIAIYRRALGDRGGNFVFQTRADRARYFSHELRTLWNKADARTAKGDQNPPGFDPITNSQDPMVKDPRVEMKERSRNTALVAASFIGWDDAARTTVLYAMRRSRGRWVIDDIRGTTDGTEWSIKKIVRDWER